MRGAAGAFVEDYTQTGTTVFGGFTVKYSSTKPASNGSDIKLYNDSQFGYETVNLLLSKNGGTWTISGIPTGNAKKALLSIKTSAKDREPELSTTTTGVTIGERVFGSETSKPYSYTWEISFTDVKLFNLTFTLNNSSNNRLDDIVLKVTEAK